MSNQTRKGVSMSNLQWIACQSECETSSCFVVEETSTSLLSTRWFKRYLPNIIAFITIKLKIKLYKTKLNIWQLRHECCPIHTCKRGLFSETSTVTTVSISATFTSFFTMAKTNALKYKRTSALKHCIRTVYQLKCHVSSGL